MVTLGILFTSGKVTAAELAGNAATHGVLGILFAVAYVRTAGVSPSQRVR